MSSEKSLLVVLGATGTQGGSVLSYFLSLSPSPYTLRGFTRNLSSPKALSWAAAGVEMVAGDYDDRASLDAAFKGASAIFSNTDIWQNFGSSMLREKAAAKGVSIGALARDIEVQQNKNIIDAAAQIDSLERLVFSSLPYVSKLTRGKYSHVYNFDAKGIAEEYGRSTYPKLWEKTNVFYAGHYLDNQIMPVGDLFRAKLNKSKDTLILYMAEPLATTIIPMYSAADDTGPLVHALLRTPPGTKLLGVNEWLSLRDLAAILAGELGKGIEFVNRNPDFGLGDSDLVRNHEDTIGFIVEFGYDGGKVDKSIVLPRDLGVPVHLASVKEWCRKQDWENILQVDGE